MINENPREEDEAQTEEEEARPADGEPEAEIACESPEFEGHPSFGRTPMPGGL
jgi:hypothetical protein